MPDSRAASSLVNPNAPVIRRGCAVVTVIAPSVSADSAGLRLDAPGNGRSDHCESGIASGDGRHVHAEPRRRGPLEQHRHNRTKARCRGCRSRSHGPHFGLTARVSRTSPAAPRRDSRRPRRHSASAPVHRPAADRRVQVGRQPRPAADLDALALFGIACRCPTRGVIVGRRFRHHGRAVLDFECLRFGRERFQFRGTCSAVRSSTPRIVFNFWRTSD